MMQSILPRLVWLAQGVVAAALLFSAHISIAQPGAAPPEPPPEQGVVLLHNGETLQGRITRQGDRVFIRMERGEISLRASDIDCCCRNPAEAYGILLGRVHSDWPEDYLRLADWCQRNGLIAESFAAIAEAKRLAPGHPMIGLIERRIHMAQNPMAAPQPAGRAAAGEVSGGDLDRLIRGMPPGTVETFTDVVQPLLMNNCTAAGCHGPNSTNQFSLLRAPTGRAATRRLTQQNLYRVLRWVNRDDPANSPLVTVPAKPHGSAAAPIFASHRANQYQQIIDWVYRVSRPELAPATPLAAQGWDDALSHGAGLQANPFDTGPVVAVGHAEVLTWEGLPGVAVVDAASVAPQPAVPPVSPVPDVSAVTNTAIESKKAPKAAPRQPPVEANADPFDPEVFNRRYHGTP